MKKRKFSYFNMAPIQKVLLGFAALIFLGTILILLPFSTYNGISLVDAIFTATSAVCVTGLIVLDTAKDFTLFGKIVILMLIQLGGLGIMTFSLALLSMIGTGLSLKWRFTFENIYSITNKISIKNLLKRIVIYTFSIEIITATILYSQFSKDFSFGKAIMHSIFHAVSAFCNAGFSTFSDNLIKYKGNIVIIITISTVIIIGGLGFIVLNELFRIKVKRNSSIFSQLSFHSRIVLLMSGFLILLGMFVFILLEWGYALKDMNIVESLLTSFFQSVTCRTAGFNTIEISSLRESTHFMMMFLMFIGGSPGSIAGGIKTTTICVVFLLIYSKFRGKKQVVIWNRALEQDSIEKSMTLIILSFLFISLSTFFILTVRDFDLGHSFLSVLFETVSAFGTVGLSMGITNQLPDLDKIIISCIMFIGRLGPLTLIMALTLKKINTNIEYPEEHVMIG